MNDTGWRIIQINSGAKIGIKGKCLSVAQEEEHLIPLNQIRSVIMEAQDVSISVKAVAELTKAYVQLVVCDEKHNPLCEIAPYHIHTRSSANLYRQIRWADDRKDRLWAEIVRQKLRNQMELMEAVKPGSGKLMKLLFDRIKPGDTQNCEATGAGYHFRTLFGYTFSRRSAGCPANAALNYGYAILLSSVNRALAVYGYKSELGIHHCSDVNPFNLSCDMMEPFRPLVDAIALSIDNDEDELTFENRQKLIAWQYDTVLLDNYHYSVHDAIDLFVKDCLDYMNGETDRVREVKCFG